LALRRFAVKYHIIRFLFVIIVVCMRYTIALTFSPAAVIEATSAKISICQQSEFVDHGSDFFPKPSKFLLGKFLRDENPCINCQRKNKVPM